jgi:NADH dehydrogenase
MKIVIVGGGFAGVKTALELAKDTQLSITLISDRDHFLFYPALYATATGRSKRQSIIPLTDIFKHTDVKIILDTVTSIDPARRYVIANNHQIHFDRAVFALGVVTSYFGLAGLDKYSYSIKSAPEIDRFKRHLHGELTSKHHLDKNYIIVGAGPTGVELSAAMAHYLQKIAKNHNVRHSKIRLDLVEAAPRVLPRMSESSSELVEQQLKKVGVSVMTNKKVESEDDDSIIISGKDIPSKTVVWTSGVANHPFFSEHAGIFTLAKNGRVEVDERLKVDKHIFVIGDNASTDYTGLAQTAIHDAKFVSRVIRSEVRQLALPHYKAMKQPVVIPVGENWAILEYGPLRISGFIGSLIRRAADVVGYLEYFPLPKAINLFFGEMQNEEDCPVCK